MGWKGKEEWKEAIFLSRFYKFQMANAQYVLCNYIWFSSNHLKAHWNLEDCVRAVKLVLLYMSKRLQAFLCMYTWWVPIIKRKCKLFYYLPHVFSNFYNCFAHIAVQPSELMQWSNTLSWNALHPQTIIIIRLTDSLINWLTWVPAQKCLWVFWNLILGRKKSPYIAVHHYLVDSFVYSFICYNPN